MHILVVDDELSMREYLDLLLSGAGHRVDVAGTVGAAKALLAEHRFDLVLSDMKLGQGGSGLQVMEAARAQEDAPEVILITAYGTPESAVQAMREGAYDYICKPFDNEELKLLVQKALEKRSLLAENRAFRRSLSGDAGHLWIGKTPAMQHVLKLIQKVAAGKSTVLIHGESGTGKELVARAIHLNSPRAGEPWLPVNCAAINEGVLESELFGHVKGAYTGAASDRRGLLETAGEGTIFLDEVGEIPASIQVKLLRALQERTVRPVGGSREVPFEARIVAATNRKLEEEVKAGRFREDLFYRLNVISIDLPPLRARPDDIPAMARLFLARVGEELGRTGLHFSDEALGVLRAYPWPGNIRQLQNVVERAATLADEDTLGPDTLPPSLRGESEPSGAVTAELGEGFSLEHHLDETERRYLRAALERSGGVKTKAAELLGLTFRSFRYRLAKHGLSDDESPS